MQSGQVVEGQESTGGTNSAAEATRKALVVAVSDYSSSLQTLEFCKKDGEDTYHLLKSLGYEITVDHKLVGHVSYESMREAIIDFFTEVNNKAEDTLLFYYSGHGIPDVDGDIYLASSEIDPDAPYRRGFSFNELTKMIQRSVSIRIVTILDCCYSGSAKLSKGHEEDAAKLGTVAIDNKANILQQGEGKCLLAASQAAQEAYALKEGDHSIFTYYLLEGLKGTERSVDAYGNITPYSLGNFIYRSILNLPAKKRPKQKPITKVEASGDIILASYPDLVKSKTVDNTSSSPITETQAMPKSQSEKQEEDTRSSSSSPYPLTSSRKDAEPDDHYYNPQTTRQKEEQRRHGINPKILIPIIGAVAVVGGVVAFTFLGQMNQALDTESPATEESNQQAQEVQPSAPTSSTPATTNNLPVPVDQTVSTNMTTSIPITLAANDQDQNDNLIAQIVSPPSNGELSEINQNTGVVTYTPNPDFIGTDEFTFKVTDGESDSINVGRVKIQVFPNNV